MYNLYNLQKVYDRHGFLNLHNFYDIPNFYILQNLADFFDLYNFYAYVEKLFAFCKRLEII